MSGPDQSSLVSSDERRQPGAQGSGNDSQVIRVRRRFRPPTLSYLAEVARAAEAQPFHAVLTPTGTWCKDAWIATAALSRETKRPKFLVAFVLA